MLIHAIIATVLVSAISLIGILIFSKNLKKSPWVKRLIGLAVGTLLGVVFLDLLPEAVESFNEPHTASIVILISIVAFFIIEKTIHYHHCSCENEEHGHKKNHLIVNNLIGDGLHNFIDGTIIAGAFLVDPRLGIGTTIAVALHEIPQEVSDFSILVYAGLSRLRAVLYNALFGLTSVVGAILIFTIASTAERIVPFLLAIAAGNFIYLAMADLIPELHHEENPRRIWLQLLWVAIGIAIIYGVTTLFGHGHE